MAGLKRIKSIHEFIEVDRELGVERTYIYDSRASHHMHTAKQEIDIIESPVWGKMLFLDRTLQSTTKDEVIYHNALVHPLLDFLKDKQSILILGGGEGATAREVLRWNAVQNVIMVDYDRELVEYMKRDISWSKGALRDKRLRFTYDDAWNYMKAAPAFNGIIVDLTDPDLKAERWQELLTLVMASVLPTKGGFVINAGLYMPWKVESIKQLKRIIEGLCTQTSGYKYNVYTAMIPSFNGEWAFISVAHSSKFMPEPEYVECIPLWIRRQIRTLPDSLIDGPIAAITSQVDVSYLY